MIPIHVAETSIVRLGDIFYFFKKLTCFFLSIWVSIWLDKGYACALFFYSFLKKKKLMASLMSKSMFELNLDHVHTT